MSFEVEGVLHKKYETENKSDTFQAREFVIKTDGNYPQFVKFQLTQDRCSLVDGMNEGEVVKVYFDLRGREWQGKYFTNLNAWKLEKGSATATPPPPTAGGSTQAPPSGFGTFDGPAPTKPADSTETDFDDLPF
jgi:hypothetical protein